MSEHHESRLAKLQKIESLGIDPWGHHLPDRIWNADARRRAGEVRFKLADGSEIDLPNFEAASDPVDYREWKQQAGQGEEIGPTVRVAGSTWPRNFTSSTPSARPRPGSPSQGR